MKPLLLLALAQGPLAPPAAPAPTQKSLQEIWNKIGTLETQLTAVSGINAISAAGLALPWNLTAGDTAGSVGSITSLAFGPDGQPAISYFYNTSSDLKIARKGIFSPAP